MEQHYQQFTIIMTEGAQQAYDQAMDQIREADRWIAEATEPDEQHNRAERVRLMRQTFHSEWGILTGINRRDGDLTLSWDCHASVFFRYASGYHGGLIFHPDYENGNRLPVGRWSIHT
jgi:hypothetical protein